MNKRSLVNLLLFIFLLAAGSWFYYIKNQPVDIKRLTTLNIDNIKQIRIPKDNGNGILFEKSTNTDNTSNWLMLKPYKINAHQFRVNTLLSLTQTPIEKSYNTTDLKLSDFSLDKPRARIVFDKTEVVFGKSNPLSSKRYIMAENKMTLLLDQTYPLVSAQAATFVDLHLLAGASDISSIKLPRVSIRKNKDNQWQSTPENSLNKNQINELFDHWKTAQAFSVHPYLPRKQLGDIEIILEDRSILFVISDDAPWLILARPDLNIEYHLDKAFKEKLIPVMDADTGTEDA